MKTRTSAAVLALMLSVALALGPSAAGMARAAGEPFITVTVRQGDSLATYATLYGVSGSALVAANHLANAQIILPGQVLTIPVVQTFTPSLTTPFYYVPQSGDTLSGIAARFSMDYFTIAAANGITNSLLIAGKTYLIPAGPHVHTVARNENLMTIAARYGVSLSFLQTANPGVSNPAQLFVGQRIFIPIIYDAAPVPLGGAAPVPTVAPVTPTATVSATPPPVATGSFITVTVRSGESFVTYTSRYGVDGGAIRAANPQIKNVDLIYPGQVLTIPVIATFTPSRTTPFFYTIVAGDTASGIAAKFEMTTGVLLGANPGASIITGRVLLVPPGPHSYIVQRGDELRTIAPRFGATVSALLTANPFITNPELIYTGQQLFIPLQYNAAPLPFGP
ncbi:MAG: LysM peptidoglycan-binding domain-containing protein [Chloroflexi bacterium]|nr:LysM peptidoglycan-binding domain-containing protein [Chloroflexota bacterium]